MTNQNLPEKTDWIFVFRILHYHQHDPLRYLQSFFLQIDMNESKEVLRLHRCWWQISNKIDVVDKFGFRRIGYQNLLSLNLSPVPHLRLQKYHQLQVRIIRMSTHCSRFFLRTYFRYKISVESSLHITFRFSRSYLLICYLTSQSYKNIIFENLTKSHHSRNENQKNIHFDFKIRFLIRLLTIFRI